MSHVTKLKLKISNFTCLQDALKRITGAAFLGKTTVDYFNKRQHGIAFQLPSFVYPIVVNPETYELYADMYGGKWGDQKELDKLMQHYAVECTKSFAENNDYYYEEQTNENGEIRCTLTSKDAYYA